MAITKSVFRWVNPIIGVVVFCLPDLANCQQWISGIGLQGNRGIVYSPQPEVNHLTLQPTWAAQLDLEPRGLLNNSWRRLYRDGMFGVTALVNSNGPNKTLGTSVALGLYGETHAYKGEHNKWMIRMAIGPTWSSNPFHLKENPRNVAIGSPFSVLLQGQISWLTRLHGPIWLRTGLVMTHYSNGGSQMPNFGLNMPGLAVGIHYHPDFKPGKQDTLPQERKGWYGVVQGQTGVAENFPTGGPKYPTYAIGGYLGYRLNAKSGLTVAAEYMYNRSLIVSQGREPNIKGLTPEKWGFMVGHELFISRFSLHTQVGYYLYPISLGTYQRLSCYYQIWGPLRVGGSVKLHGFSAEVAEGLLAYRFQL